jgi:hypothetical protein
MEERRWQRFSIKRPAFCALLQQQPTFWMNLQTRYALEVAEDEIADKVERDVRPLEAAPVRQFKTKDEPAKYLQAAARRRAEFWS